MPIDLRELGELIRALNPYSQQMEHPPNSQAAVQQGQEGAAAREQFQLEVDDYAANYATGSWTFRGQQQSIKRALRVTYRYPLIGANGQPTRFYATEHLLIGYAGSDSG